MNRKIDANLLKQRLLNLESTFDFQERVINDPVQFPFMFKNPDDVETAGLIASSFAYGSVKIIIATLNRIFDKLGPSPSDFTENFYKSQKTEREQTASLFKGFYHRFNNDDDLRTLLFTIGRIRKEWGSLNSLFLEGYGEGGSFESFENGVNHFSDTFIRLSKESPFKGMRKFDYFFPAPRKGSTCKRLCLYFRWMNRKGGTDPGGWQGVKKSDLVIPVDTHIARIGRYLGFTKRKNTSWKMALEITEALKKLDPDDPLRYDFLICHLGISGECPNKYNENKCQNCPIRDICVRGN